MDIEYAEVEVENEEIIIHPTARRAGIRWIIEYRVLGNVVIEGQRYEFEKVIEQDVKKVEED